MPEIAPIHAARAALLRSIGVGGEAAEHAAVTLKAHPEWTTGKPPLELLQRILDPACDPDSQVFDVARKWERNPMCCALFEALAAAPDPELKIQIAWLLKQFPDIQEWERYVAIARLPKEPPHLRRFLIEGLEYMVFGRALDWEELGAFVEELRSDREPTVREGVAGLLGSLSNSDGKIAMLTDMLYDHDDAVTAVALAMLAGLPPRKDAVLLGRAKQLLNHRSLSVRMLAERLIIRLNLQG